LAQPTNRSFEEHTVSIPAPARRTHDDVHPSGPGHDDHEEHEHDLGLSHDLPTIMNRRRLLTFLGGAGAAAALAACGAGDSTGTAATSSAGGPGGPGGAGGPGGEPPADGGSTVEVAEGEIPEETAGPYPGDGSNGVNVLAESGIVRSDITQSFGTASGVAAGVRLTIKLKVIDLSDDGKALAGSAVYLWHCDRAGRYSLYSEGVTEENYLRGVQEADADGYVTFTSIYPAAYSGRWPHIHFEVYPGLDQAGSSADKLRTSQLALPEDISNTVYATDGYEASVANMTQTPLSSDNVFSDGYSLQMAKVTGSVGAGYTATLTVPV
jgi:protocatechuate 3,4-dioxygenase beta subunit